jgi:hypothetical protein
MPNHEKADRRDARPGEESDGEVHEALVIPTFAN